MTAPKPFSDEEIERQIEELDEPGRWGEWQQELGAMLRQLLFRCQTAEAQLRQADEVLFWRNARMSFDLAVERHEMEAIARHRARST